MNAKTKKLKVPGFMREVVAQNLEALMQSHLKEEGDKFRALSKAAGVSKSTVQRIMSRDVGVSLDNLEAIAAVFQLSAYQILIPGLNTAAPQMIPGALKEEERLYRLWKKEPTLTYQNVTRASDKAMGKKRGKAA